MTTSYNFFFLNLPTGVFYRGKNFIAMLTSYLDVKICCINNIMFMCGVQEMVYISEIFLMRVSVLCRVNISETYYLNIPFGELSNFFSNFITTCFCVTTYVDEFVPKRIMYITIPHNICRTRAMYLKVKSISIHVGFTNQNLRHK